MGYSSSTYILAVIFVFMVLFTFAADAWIAWVRGPCFGELWAYLAASATPVGLKREAAPLSITSNSYSNIVVVHLCAFSFVRPLTCVWRRF